MPYVISEPGNYHLCGNVAYYPSQQVESEQRSITRDVNSKAEEFKTELEKHRNPHCGSTLSDVCKALASMNGDVNVRSVVSRDLNSESLAAIKINASNVHLDLCNFTLSQGNDTSDVAGTRILLQGDGSTDAKNFVKNVVLKNNTVVGVKSSEEPQYDSAGIMVFGNVPRFVIDGNRVRDCDTGIYLIHVGFGGEPYEQKGILRSNEVSDCSVGGFIDLADQTLSLFMDNVSYDNGSHAQNYTINWKETPPVVYGDLTNYPSTFSKVANISVVK